MPAASPQLHSSNFELQVIADMQETTYEEAAQRHGISRGKVYEIALRHGARKTENRIMERKRSARARQKAFLEDMIGNTVKADVLDFLAHVPDTSVQLTVTSTPYNQKVPYAGGSSADDMDPIYFLGWLTMIVAELSRITRPGGMVFLQVGSTRDETDNLIPMDILLFDILKRAGLTFQNRVVWKIPHGLTPKKRLAERHETALIFSKGEPAVFNANAARIPQKQPGKRAFKGPNKGKLSGHPLGAAPTNVWDDIGNIGHNHPEKTGHPAQFPIALPMRAIGLYTMPGDVVCDPFCGSGTTQEAAVRQGRAFIGADLAYEDVRTERLAAAGLDDVCLFPGVTEESLAVWRAEARRVEINADGDNEPGLLGLLRSHA